MTAQGLADSQPAVRDSLAVLRTVQDENDAYLRRHGEMVAVYRQAADAHRTAVEEALVAGKRPPKPPADPEWDDETHWRLVHQFRHRIEQAHEAVRVARADAYPAVAAAAEERARERAERVRPLLESLLDFLHEAVQDESAVRLCRDASSAPGARTYYDDPPPLDLAAFVDQVMAGSERLEQMQQGRTLGMTWQERKEADDAEESADRHGQTSISNLPRARSMRDRL